MPLSCLPRPSMRARIAIAGGGALVGLAVIAGAFAFSASGAPPPTRPPQGLANPNLPYATDAHLEPTFASSLHRDATRRVEAATNFARNPPTKDPNTPTPIPTVDHPASRTGIITGPLPDEDSFTFANTAVIENFYRAFPNSSAFVVAAGASKRDPQQGFVGVAAAQKTGLVVLNTSLTPTKHGSVHITAVNGSLVTLAAADGTTFTFDDTTYTFR